MLMQSRPAASTSLPPMEHMLSSYGLDTPFPTEWSEQDGVELDHFQGNSTKAAAEGTNGTSTTTGIDKDNFTLLEQVMASLTGTTSSVVDDERDPLGSTDSIRAVLLARGVDVDSNVSERAKYMLSSTKFQPRLFLRTVHAQASYEDLVHGLRYLQSSIATNDDSVRLLVDEDYERFVNSKRKLDEVMAQAASSGLTESQEWGVATLRRHVDDVTAKLALYSRPLDLYGAQKARYASALATLDKYKRVFALPTLLRAHVDAHDHDGFVRDLQRGREQLQELKEAARDAGKAATAVARHVSSVVAESVDEYRTRLWRQLMNTPADGAYGPLLSRLADLGVTENPALAWMNHRIQVFWEDIDSVFEDLAGVAAGQARSSSDFAVYLVDLSPPTGLSGIAGADSFVEEALERLDTTDPDSADVLAGWTEVLGLFTKLRQVLGDACIFWRERAAIRAPVGSPLVLTPSEDAAVTRRSAELVQMAARKLTDACQGDDFVHFQPRASNSLSAAKYLSRILRVLTDTEADVGELMGSSNPLISAVASTRQQFVKTLGECWARDATSFGGVQNWEGADAQQALMPVPGLFEGFHALMLESMRQLLGVSPPSSLVKRVSGVFSAALSLSVKSIHSSLVDSERAAWAHASQLRPRSMSQDAKLLVTLDNMDRLGREQLPHLYDRWDRLVSRSASTGEKGSTIAASVSPILDQLSSGLFDLFARKKRARLSQIVQHETSRLSRKWTARGGDPPTGISSYVLESLMVLVEIHAQFVALCPQTARHALLVLYQHWLQAVLDATREMDTLGVLGTLQTVADLEFVRSTMARLATSESHQLCQRIFDAIKQASTDASLWQGQDAPRSHVRGVIEKALSSEHLAFLCFKA